MESFLLYASYLYIFICLTGLSARHYGSDVLLFRAMSMGRAPACYAWRTHGMQNSILLYWLSRMARGCWRIYFTML